MKKKLVVVVAVLLLLVGLVAVTSFIVFNQKNESKSFYVGVTYCGSSVQEAKELVDRVKNYTNLFVLQSGSLLDNTVAMEEIGAYVVAQNLSYAISGSTSDLLRLNQQQLSIWLIEAKERWGEQFIGTYYNDQPGGKMLDDAITLKKDAQKIDKTTLHQTISKFDSRSIATNTENGSAIYGNNGEISLMYFRSDPEQRYPVSINYYPNGSIILKEVTLRSDNLYTAENITKYDRSIPSYEELMAQNPIQNCDDAANAFVDMHKELFAGIDKKQLNKNDLLVFTADYGLYWWDYKGGYDVVLAELAWNHSDAQHIGLVRGAANLQDKSWGTILTWKYTHSPYLVDGAEMFEQLNLSYEAGAEYVIIFNYSDDPTNPNILQEEHFEALERFWNEVVQNPEIIHGGIPAEAVLVLPNNYGWGMRNPNDNIWGLWDADDTCQQIWHQMQTRLNQYGTKLDIVYDDPHYPIANRYPNIYYWNE